MPPRTRSYITPSPPPPSLNTNAQPYIPRLQRSVSTTSIVPTFPSALRDPICLQHLHCSNTTTTSQFLPRYINHESYHPPITPFSHFPYCFAKGQGGIRIVSAHRGSELIITPLKFSSSFCCASKWVMGHEWEDGDGGRVR